MPQLWTLSVARREKWAPHCGPLRPLGRKPLLPGSRWPGSASWGRTDGDSPESRRSVRTLRPCPLDLEEMPEAVCPHFILKLLLRVSSCLCRCQAATFLPASGNSSWKPVNGRDFLTVQGIGFRSPAWSPPRSADGALGLLGLVCVPFGTLGRREEDIFNFQSTPTPSLSQPGGRKCCGSRLGALSTRVFALPGFPRIGWGDTVAQRVPTLAPLVTGSGWVRQGRRPGGASGLVWRKEALTQVMDSPHRGVSWVLLVVDFRRIRAGLALLCGWAVRQQRLLVP